MDPALCGGREPVGVYCKTAADDVSWELTGETLACSLAAGGLRCLNQDNAQVAPKYPRRFVAYLLARHRGAVRSTAIAIGCGVGPGLQHSKPCPFSALASALHTAPIALHAAALCRLPGMTLVRQGCSDYKIRLACPTASPSASPTVTSTPTEAPTWDAGGQPCSGHGQCAGSGGCACQCSSGWYGAQCGKFFIRSATARALLPARLGSRLPRRFLTRGRSGARRGERVRRRAARALVGLSVPSRRGGRVLLAGKLRRACARRWLHRRTRRATSGNALFGGSHQSAVRRSLAAASASRAWRWCRLALDGMRIDRRPPAL